LFRDWPTRRIWSYPATFTNLPQYITYSDYVSFLFINPLQHTALLRVYFDVYLIRLKFYQHITLLDSITFIFEPLCNHGIYYGFAQCWYTNFGGHVCLPFKTH